MRRPYNNIYYRTMEKLLDGLRLVLASASPRRRELLLQIGAQVRIASTKEVDESYPGNIAPEDVAPYISAKKAHAYADSIESGETLITADTVVICEGCVLGKPHNEHEAVEMLRQLSGRTHSVVTGVTIMNGERCRTFGVTTEVDFAPLSDSEIRYYVEKYRPLDKAGAYGIQEWIGYIGITGIRGDYYNVMGLPLQRLYTELKELHS